ncbi:hypothetical protein M0804_007702 [Polistes exclamans]|nr:hypothetical protein M0804_007702 [Polistes exclamans]
MRPHWGCGLGRSDSDSDSDGGGGSRYIRPSCSSPYGLNLGEYPVNPYTWMIQKAYVCLYENVYIRTTTKYTGCPGIHRRLTSGETTSTSTVLNGQSLGRFPDCPVGLSTLKQTP